MLFSGRAYPELADEIAAAHRRHGHPDDRPASSPTARSFIRPDESVRGSDAFVIQSYTTPINQWVMETLILVDALKRASAKRITVVAPFYPYARQDKKHRGREPISARLIADLFKTAGADRLMAIDLHTAQIQGFFDGPVDHLFALPLLAEYVAKTYGGEDLTSCRPTPAGCAPPSSGPTGSAARHRVRPQDPRLDVPNEVVANRVVGEVAGRMLPADRRHDRHRRHRSSRRRTCCSTPAPPTSSSPPRTAIFSAAGRRPAQEQPGHAR